MAVSVSQWISAGLPEICMPIRTEQKKLEVQQSMGKGLGFGVFLQEVAQGYSAGLMNVRTEPLAQTLQYT